MNFIQHTSNSFQRLQRATLPMYYVPPSAPSPRFYTGICDSAHVLLEKNKIRRALQSTEIKLISPQQNADILTAILLQQKIQSLMSKSPNCTVDVTEKILPMNAEFAERHIGSHRSPRDPLQNKEQSTELCETKTIEAKSTQLPESKKVGRPSLFPRKLYQMLSDLEKEPGGTDIASFLPHGRAFAIHKPEEFVKHVLPKYFNMGSFPSFQRQLNMYNFQQISAGGMKNAYCHEHFVNGEPTLCKQIRRTKQDNSTSFRSRKHKEYTNEDLPRI